MDSRLSRLDGAPRHYAWGSPTAIPGLLGVPPTGEPVAELWFDRRLPFLLKILAADTALSIQVHPDLDQAREGFAREERRGIALDAPERNYRDVNHKPELLCAVTPFTALCGFRPAADTIRFLDALDVGELTPFRRALAGPDGLKAAFTAMLAVPRPIGRGWSTPPCSAVGAWSPVRWSGGTRPTRWSSPPRTSPVTSARWSPSS